MCWCWNTSEHSQHGRAKVALHSLLRPAGSRKTPGAVVAALHGTPSTPPCTAERARKAVERPWSQGWRVVREELLARLDRLRGHQPDLREAERRHGNMDIT